jgi:hypothetical protein
VVFSLGLLEIFDPMNHSALPSVIEPQQNIPRQGKPYFQPDVNVISMLHHFTASPNPNPKPQPL